MIKRSNPAAQPRCSSHNNQFSRWMITLLTTCSLIACASSPTKTVNSEGNSQKRSGSGMTAAAKLYNAGSYQDALMAFDTVITDKRAAANNRRLANLGKAMVYLGSDKKLHSVENAKMALISAGKVKAKGNEKFSIETNLLMDAVSAVIGTESKFEVLKEKSGGSNVQVARLKRERGELETERDELLEEQKVLNEALEKLKQLTLGN